MMTLHRLCPISCIPVDLSGVSGNVKLRRKKHREPTTSVLIVQALCNVCKFVVVLPHRPAEHHREGWMANIQISGPRIPKLNSISAFIFVWIEICRKDRDEIIYSSYEYIYINFEVVKFERKMQIPSPVNPCCLVPISAGSCPAFLLSFSRTSLANQQDAPQCDWIQLSLRIVTSLMILQPRPQLPRTKRPYNNQTENRPTGLFPAASMSSCSLRKISILRQVMETNTGLKASASIETIVDISDQN